MSDPTLYVAVGDTVQVRLASNSPNLTMSAGATLTIG